MSQLQRNKSNNSISMDLPKTTPLLDGVLKLKVLILSKSKLILLSARKTTIRLMICYLQLRVPPLILMACLVSVFSKLQYMAKIVQASTIFKLFQKILKQFREFERENHQFFLWSFSKACISFSSHRYLTHK